MIMRDKILQWLGKTYLLNTKSMEIHDTTALTKQCGVHLMNPKNKKLLTRRQNEKAITEGIYGRTANGCRWCNKETDTDI